MPSEAYDNVNVTTVRPRAFRINIGLGQDEEAFDRRGRRGRRPPGGRN